MSVAEAFDQLAPRYDETWTRSVVGRLQREAVWREIAPLFLPGARVLDLGCGTGEDALHLARGGVRVHAIDVAPGMVKMTRQRLESDGLTGQITCEVLAAEDLFRLKTTGVFDGAITNFGVLNCVRDLRSLAGELARLVRPGGRLVLCPMGRFYLWETIWYLLRARLGKAFRRLRRGGVTASVGSGHFFPVFYASVADISAAFEPYFRRVGFRGIGVFVPPPSVKASPGVFRALVLLDRLFAGWPLLRAIGDHYLLIFVRR